jgi:hypothetical protein
VRHSPANRTPVAQNHHCPGKSSGPIEIPLTVQARVPLGQAAGYLGSVVMFEAVTAFFGVMSAGIFIAHAVDGYRSRA